MQLLGVIVEENGSLFIVTEYMAKVGGRLSVCEHLSTSRVLLMKMSHVCLLVSFRAVWLTTYAPEAGQYLVEMLSLILHCAYDCSFLPCLHLYQIKGEQCFVDRVSAHEMECRCRLALKFEHAAS